jgi:hypothetical protein
MYSGFFTLYSSGPQLFMLLVFMTHSPPPQKKMSLYFSAGDEISLKQALIAIKRRFD